MYHTRLYAVILAPLIACLTVGCSESPAPTASQTDVAEPLSTSTPIAQIESPSPLAPSDTDAQQNENTDIQEMEWDNLIPADYSPETILARYDLDDMEDDDPRADQLQRELRELWDKAPVRSELDGQRIKLPGFVVPVESDAEETTGFLLVPYYGACIHVPPPPANQTVYVVTEKGRGTRPKVFDVVQVTGDLSVRRIDNDIAEAGYTLYATQIEPYE